jgi:hypothetical protein
MKKKFIIIFIGLSIYFCLFGIQKINLTAADIGRHVKNGELTLTFFFNHDWKDSYSLLHTNFYSYTNTGTSFVNHHWGSGVLAYLIFAVSGWNGLSFTYLLLMLGALFFAFKLAYEKSSLLIASPIALFLIPLIAERSEVRPEAVSYLGILAFIYILYRYTDGTLKEKYLWFIPISLLFWANLHIYFIFGFFVLGAFGLEALIRKNWVQFKKLLRISGVSLVTASINPYGPYLLYYPFVIFKNYGYLVAENQSISFLEKLNFANPNFLWWKITIVLCILTVIITLITRLKKLPIALSIITLTFGYLSFSAIRNLTLFGLVALPFLAITVYTIFEGRTNKVEEWMLWTYSASLTLVIILFSLFHFSTRLPTHTNWGFGLLPNNMASAEFVKTAGITGPFFNNYDIGGYIILNSYPEKVFVDNRPEAYPTEFFQNEYIPMQENDAIWKQEEQKYNFNAIWFYRLDMTPWAQEFLISKIHDPEWVPVFVDDYTIIFIKNTPQNANIIKQYALPASMFGVK